MDNEGAHGSFHMDEGGSDDHRLTDTALTHTDGLYTGQGSSQDWRSALLIAKPHFDAPYVSHAGSQFTDSRPAPAALPSFPNEVPVSHLDSQLAEDHPVLALLPSSPDVLPVSPNAPGSVSLGSVQDCTNINGSMGRISKVYKPVIGSTMLSVDGSSYGSTFSIEEERSDATELHSMSSTFPETSYGTDQGLHDRTNYGKVGIEQSVLRGPFTHASEQSHHFLQTQDRPIITGLRRMIRAWRLIRNACLRLGRQNPAPGTRRVEWICSCGSEVYDDYLELHDGDLSELQAEMNAMSTDPEETLEQCMSSDIPRHMSPTAAPATVAHGIVTGSSGEEGEVSAGSSRRVFAPPANLAHGARGINRAPALSYCAREIDAEAGGLSQETPSATEKNALHLILGYPLSHLATKVQQPDVSNVVSDREFFKNLRAQYLDIRGGSHRRFFSLKGLVDVRFVQLELLDTNLAEICKHDDIPPPELCSSFMSSGSDIDLYTYNPTPAKRIPPIGKQTLMHLMEHPSAAFRDRSTLLDRVPRKLHQKLQTCPQKGYGIGWGLQYVEGISTLRVFVSGFACALLSTIFGVAYSAKQKDVQGGFAVAAYMMMLLIFMLGSAQAVLDK